MFRLILLSILFMSYDCGQAIETDPRDKTQCINQVIEWCDGMQYSDQGISFITESHQTAQGFYRVICFSDSHGTNCSRNASPWFTCAPDRSLTYKGKALTTTTADVDNICEVADMAMKISARKMPFDHAAFNKGFQRFFDEMSAMQDQMGFLRKKMNSMNTDFWAGFTVESPFV